MPVNVKEPKINLHFSFSRSLKNAFLMLLESKYKKNLIISRKEFLLCIKVGREGHHLGFKDYVETFTTIFHNASRGVNGS